jgi:hypothetical protein
MDFFKTFWPQLLTIAFAALASLAFHRFEGRRKEALRAAARAALVARFGPEIAWSNGKPQRLDAPAGFALLREPASAHDVLRAGAEAVLSWDVIVRVQDRYAHVLISGRCNLWGESKLQLNPLAVTDLTELRARRALFNDAKAYQRAFGELPDRARLAKLAPEPSMETAD